MAIRYREDRISGEDFSLITQAIPNRINYFDGIVCDMFPINIQNITSTDDSNGEEYITVVYPNPASDFIHLDLIDGQGSRANIYNSAGGLVLSRELANGPKIEISKLPAGVYFLILDNNGKLSRSRFMKM
ncbi:MAG: T9SS type A sorting domain-containing protein [Lewinellaceae bacterium]|nr:T9SS type A sorting domain-containing protein [Phaeodactylibacter sp.]MCB9040072.1 T9SS type A sorting domain-containing protein [Lewinellaceae bacterium]